MKAGIKLPEGLDLHRIRRGLALALTIGITAGVAVVLVTGGREVLAGIRRLPIVYLLLALALSVLAWFGQGLGFAALAKGRVRGRILPMTRAFLGGDFAALVTPFGSGGIPAGVLCLTREGLTTGEASAVIAMHSLLTGGFFVLLGVGAALVMPVRAHAARVLVWTSVAAIAVVVGLILWLALRPHDAVARLERVFAGRWLIRLTGEHRAERVREFVSREALQFARDTEALMRETPQQLALSFFGLFMSRVALIVCLPVIMYGLGWRGALAPMLATGVAALALAIVSPTPGGSGAVEMATTALLATQTSTATAAAAAILWRSVTYYTEVLAGWAFLTHYMRGPDQR